MNSFPLGTETLGPLLRVLLISSFCFVPPILSYRKGSEYLGKWIKIKVDFLFKCSEIKMDVSILLWGISPNQSADFKIEKLIFPEKPESIWKPRVLKIKQRYPRTQTHDCRCQVVQPSTFLQGEGHMLKYKFKTPTSVNCWCSWC